MYYPLASLLIVASPFHALVQRVVLFFSFLFPL
jgi:hypothetical protein